MTIVRPVFTANGHKRSRERLQLPATSRGALSSGTAWSLASPMQAVTPDHTWMLSAAKPALLWDTGTQAPTSSTALDLANHAYLIFALENGDQLYAVPQELWAAVSSASNLCPLAWVDAHHDLVPRLTQSTVLYALLNGTLSTDAYGTSTGGKLTYPTFTGPAPGVVGSTFPSVSGNRLASSNGAVMAILGTGQLAYLSNPNDTTTAVLVDLPRFTATDVLPRAIGINSDPTTGRWWALVEYDEGSATSRAVLALTSTVQAAVHAGDWTIGYTVLDFGPPTVPGIDAASVELGVVPPPLSPVSGSLIYDSGTGYSSYLRWFNAVYDDHGILSGVQLVRGCSVIWPDNTVGAISAQTVHFTGLPSAGVYTLSTHPTYGVQLLSGGVVPAGGVRLIDFTFTARGDLTYQRSPGSNNLDLVDTVTVASPQTFPDPSSEVFGRFMNTDLTAQGSYISDPDNTQNVAGIYSGNLIGVRTDNISVATTYTIANDFCYSFFVFQAYGGERTDGTSNFFITVNVDGVTWGSDPVDAAVERATVLPHTYGYSINCRLDYSNGPTVEAHAYIGTVTPTYQAFGIGPGGETLVNPDTGTWEYWYLSGSTIVKMPTPFTSMPAGQYPPVVFGQGWPSPVVVDSLLVYPDGSLGFLSAVLASFDRTTDAYFAVGNDGNLYYQPSASASYWNALAAIVTVSHPYQVFALRLRSSGVVDCIYGKDGKVYLSSWFPGPTFDPHTGAVTTTGPITFPTDELTTPGDLFSIAAFLN